MNQKVDKLININDLRSQILEISKDGEVNQDKLRSHIFEILKYGYKLKESQVYNIKNPFLFRNGFSFANRCITKQYHNTLFPH